MVLPSVVGKSVSVHPIFFSTFFEVSEIATSTSHNAVQKSFIRSLILCNSTLDEIRSIKSFDSLDCNLKN